MQKCVFGRLRTQYLNILYSVIGFCILQDIVDNILRVAVNVIKADFRQNRNEHM